MKSLLFVTCVVYSNKEVNKKKVGGCDAQEVETQLNFSSFNCSHLQNV